MDGVLGASETSIVGKWLACISTSCTKFTTFETDAHVSTSCTEYAWRRKCHARWEGMAQCSWKKEWAANWP